MKNINMIKSKYLKFFPYDGLSIKEIETIENVLKVELPVDFKKIASFFSGGISVGGIDFFDFKRDDNNLNIIDETLRLRKETLLNEDMIFLAELSESCVIFNVKAEPAIVWCDSIEVSIDNFLNNSFQNSPNTWDKFCDFFLEMLNSEIEDF